MQGLGKKPIIDLTGQQFERLVVVSCAGRIGRRYHWNCVCDCGTEHVVVGDALKAGLTRSCGCLKRDVSKARAKPKPPKVYVRVLHGLSKTRAHAIWKAAKQRCFDPNAHNYRHYGGRGITMCDRWRHDFSAFFADMGECPPGMSLERINHNGHYEPGNCRWATQSEQVRNTRRNIVVSVGEDQVCLKDYTRIVGASYGAVQHAMRDHGLEPLEAVKRVLERQRRRQNKRGAALPAT